MADSFVLGKRKKSFAGKRNWHQQKKKKKFAGPMIF